MLSSSAPSERVALSSNSVSEVIVVRDIVVPILYGIDDSVGLIENTCPEFRNAPSLRVGGVYHF